MSDLQRRVEELERSQPPPPRKEPAWADPKFPRQAAFVEDESPFVAALCPARTGKSYGAALKLLRKAWRTPGAKVLYTAKTRSSAKGIMWDDVLKVIDRKFKLGAEFNNAELSMLLPNGSRLVLLGLDATEDERNKVLGQKFALIVIDEAEAFRTDLYKHVYQVLKQRVADYRGQIVMTGTPHDITGGLFYDATCHPGARDSMGVAWSQHGWKHADNPYMAKKLEAEMKSLPQGAASQAWFRQMYLGEWVIDDTHLVYRLAPYNIGTMPARAGGRWTYKVGLDLGWTDANAFTVAAWHSEDPNLYIPVSYKKAGLDFHQVVDELQSLKQRWNFIQVVVDAANRQGVETMQRLVRGSGIHFTDADKPQKKTWQGIVNGSLARGQVVLHPQGAKPLIDEWKKLVRDPDSGDEDPRCENHCSDSFLYVYRNAYPDLFRAPAKELGPESWSQQSARQVREEMERHFRKARRESESADRDFLRQIRDLTYDERTFEDDA